MMVSASVGLTTAQTVQKQVVEEGGTGPFKSEVVGDVSCPGFTVYRPQNLKEVVAKQGTLPVIVYANGACFNNNVEMRLLLSEVVSHGYVAAAIGPYDEADVMAYDPRIKTCVMLNSGIGDMEMMGTTKDNLKNLHTPMFYMIGGPGDIAYANAQKDYDRIADNIPVVMLNSKDGHSGTYYEKYGGNYAKAVVKWLDWQLKGLVGQSALFLDDEYLKMKFPEWQGVRKNF